MKALITGVTGFAGGFLAEHLLEMGDEVLGCSTGGGWPPENPERRSPALSVRKRIEVLHWDLGAASGLDPHARDRIAEFAPTCIYHLAAISVPGFCGADEPTAKALAVNVEGTSRVLELAASLSPRPRVLFTSTSHVYAPSKPGSRFNEAVPLGPRRGYGKTKLAAEQRVAAACREGRLDCVIARAFQHTGPRQEPEMMLPEWCQQLVLGDSGPVRVRSLNTWIDLSDVRDVVRAYRLLVERGASGGIYNVGSGVPQRTGEIFQQLMTLAGSARPTSELSAAGEKWDPIADIGLLTGTTGWRPQIPLEKTLADTLEYWRQRAKDELT
ncbi:MAG TPA: NAD(P)-dependent oxidoreductase [Pirellulales bacterium]|nr:NAD(P)-dependent oxidoreductase [Pirellulales bacterium]